MGCLVYHIRRMWTREVKHTRGRQRRNSAREKNVHAMQRKAFSWSLITPLNT